MKMTKIVSSRNFVLLHIIFTFFISTLLSSQENKNNHINNDDNNNNFLQRSTKSVLSRIPIPAINNNYNYKSFVPSTSSSDESTTSTGTDILKQYISIDPVAVATIKQLPSSHHITTKEATAVDDSPHTLLYDVHGKSDIFHIPTHQGHHQYSLKQSSSTHTSLFDFLSKLDDTSKIDVPSLLYTHTERESAVAHVVPLLHSSLSSSSVAIDDLPTRSLMSSSTDSPLSSLSSSHQSLHQSSVASLSSTAMKNSLKPTTSLFDYLYHVDLEEASTMPPVAASVVMDESLSKLPVSSSLSSSSILSSSSSLSSTHGHYIQSSVVAPSSSLPYIHPINCSISQGLDGLSYSNYQQNSTLYDDSFKESIALSLSYLEKTDILSLSSLNQHHHYHII